MFAHLSELTQPPGVLRKSYYRLLAASAKFATAGILLSWDNEMLSTPSETNDVLHFPALKQPPAVRHSSQPSSSLPTLTPREVSPGTSSADKVSGVEMTQNC